MKLRVPVRRDTLRKDTVAGLVLGVESVPDGLAAGLLAGVNPLAGLYAYLFGTIGGSLFTSSAFMAVQATGAMAIIIADVPAVHSADDPARALFTLSVLTGVVMLAAGFFRLGSMLRFVSNAVMVGFISAVGVNIILGQLANLTGYKAAGANRVVRAVNTVIHPGELHLQSLAIGIVTVALILVLERTRAGPLGLVLAVIVTSASLAVQGWSGVATVRELSEVPRALPLPEARCSGDTGKTITIGTSSQLAVIVGVTAAYQAAAQAIGLNVILKSVSAQDYINFFTDPKFRAGIDGLPEVDYGDYADPAAMLAHIVLPGGIENFDHFNDPNIIALVEQARTTASPGKRAALIAEAEKLTAEQLPFIPDVQPDTVLVLKKGLTGAVSSSAYLFSPWADSLGGTG